MTVAFTTMRRSIRFKEYSKTLHGDVSGFSRHILCISSLWMCMEYGLNGKPIHGMIKAGSYGIRRHTLTAIGSFYPKQLKQKLHGA